MAENCAEERIGPLAGYRVLELGSTIAGPFCGRLLADFGAEVIKVEMLDGDSVRSMGKRKGKTELYATSIFRNKKVISLDLRQAEGQEVARALAKVCDVVVENFRPGTLERWSLGFEDFQRIRSDMIMVRISGFGQTGPYSGRPGFGIIGEAASGLRELTGDPDRPPARVAVSLTDYITGLYAAFGAVMAVLHRERTGEGQVVDAALYEAAFSFMEPFVPAFDQLGHVPTRAGPRLPGHAPNNLYSTADGRYIHIAAANQNLFRRLVTIMDRKDLLLDPRFATAFERGQNASEIDSIVGDWTSSYRLVDLERILIDEGGIPASRIFTLTDVFQDPHYEARGMLTRVPNAELGEIALASVVPKLSNSPGAISWAGKPAGSDTQDVLRDLAGLSDDRIAALERAGVIRCMGSKRSQTGNTT